LFTDRERAAFAFTEAVTQIGDGGVPDDVRAAVAEEFDREDVVHLLMAVATINVWNRLAVATHQRLPDT
jgi:alkylhydroperoxidase family enzyme